MYRGESYPFALKDTVTLSNFTSEVLEVTSDSRPKKVLFTLEKKLEDPGYVWLIWEGAGFIRFVPPALGQSVTLPAINYNQALGAEP